MEMTENAVAERELRTLMAYCESLRKANEEIIKSLGGRGNESTVVRRCISRGARSAYEDVISMIMLSLEELEAE